MARQVARCRTMAGASTLGAGGHIRIEIACHELHAIKKESQDGRIPEEFVLMAEATVEDTALAVRLYPREGVVAVSAMKFRRVGRAGFLEIEGQQYAMGIPRVRARDLVDLIVDREFRSGECLEERVAGLFDADRNLFVPGMVVEASADDVAPFLPFSEDGEGGMQRHNAFAASNELRKALFQCRIALSGGVFPGVGKRVKIAGQEQFAVGIVKEYGVEPLEALGFEDGDVVGNLDTERAGLLGDALESRLAIRDGAVNVTESRTRENTSTVRGLFGAAVGLSGAASRILANSASVGALGGAAQAART